MVHNGVEPFPAATEPDAELTELRQGGPVVGAIAVLRRQKRLDLLIDAAPAIFAAEPSARVVIVGTGPERENLEAHAAGLGLDRDPRFRMIPFQESSWRYLAALDLFVLPSEWEAFPIGLLEALAAGVPQVATDVGGNGEAVLDGVTGRLVELGSEQIAAAVAELLADPDRRAAMAQASRRRRDEEFTIERMVAATAAIYDGVLAAREGA
jgi:glycosyltransferase involved in cell wall biosynthesis